MDLLSGPSGVDETDNTIEGNVISGDVIAVQLSASGAKATGNKVFGNTIDLNAGGTAPVPNTDAGVNIESSGGPATGIKIGGTDAGQPNVIPNNGGVGVGIDGANTIDDQISGNSIDDNGGLGIALTKGGNGEAAAPGLSSASTISGQTEIHGTLHERPTA